MLAFINLSAQTPFSKGVNLTEWFQTSGPKQIQFTKYTKKDFENIKRLGCDVIRLPINLHFMTNGAPDYTLDPLFLQFLDEPVKWAEELNINLLLDNHTFDPAVSTDPKVGEVLVKVWGQMAEHYKNTSRNIYFEVLNEPHGITDAVWGNAQKMAIDAIRAVDSLHTIVVGGANWNSYNNLSKIPVYADTNLLYTFHFYDPFLFTHQGATWTDPSMASLAGVPYPYIADSMPACPDDLKGTWIEGSLNDYKNTGNDSAVHKLLDVAVDFKNTRNVKLFCGEFGVYIPNSKNHHRVAWYKMVREYLEQNGIGWTIWDYHGGFGIYKQGSNGMFEHDLNIPMVEALGLTSPPQTPYVQVADTVGFECYTDFIGEKVYESSSPGVGTIDFYSTDKPNNGSYCTYWKIGAQYTNVGFDFKPNKDLSVLVDSNYALDFMVRGLTPGMQFDVRFIDSKLDADDHPWRKYVTVGETRAAWDGYWQHVRIPLNSFVEQGSWDGSWYNPENKFDWKNVDRLEFSAEMANLVGKKFWFDNIHISNQDTAQIYDTSKFVDPTIGIGKINEQMQLNIWPNPASGNLNINYYLSQPGKVEITLFNLAGIKVADLLNVDQNAGFHVLNSPLKSDSGTAIKCGLYFCLLKTNNQWITRKIIIE
jgi:endoglucanase